MKMHIGTALRLTLVLILFFCVLYTALIRVFAYLAPNSGHGALIGDAQGKEYYREIGQEFTSDGYFNGRPSAAGYNAAGSAGSNKGPTNPEYLAVVQARIDTFMAHNPGIERSEIPVDLVTASGSGLDPHVSPAGAMVQVARIARARGISPEPLRALVQEFTEKPVLGILGPSRVHVLRLNMELDRRF